jgi:hypothetical protein
MKWAGSIFLGFLGFVFKVEFSIWLKREAVRLATDEELNDSTFQTYVYLVKVGKPVGPRDLMRGANLSSPSVAYRNLQKLVDLGWVAKDEYGNYMVKEKVGLKGHVWIGKNLVPSLAIFGFIFLGVLIAEVAILVPHLIAHASVQGAFWLLMVLTIVSSAIFLLQAFRSRKKPKTSILVARQIAYS